MKQKPTRTKINSGDSWDKLRAVLGELSDQPTYSEIQRVGNKLLKLPVPNDLPATNQVRIALASSFTIDPIAPALAIECHRIGLWPIIQVDGFNMYRSHIFNSNSSLYSSTPDIVFLAAELGSITPLGDDGAVDERSAADALDHLRDIVDTFKKHSTATLVINNFMVPARFPFSLTADKGAVHICQINGWLADRYRSDVQIHILDFDSLCNYHGKSRTTNPKLHYLGAVEISESFLPVLSRQYMAYVQALKGLTRKCLVLDLDGTLWGGVAGEDGLEGVRLARYGPGSEYRDFQNAILELYRRGVILAINSKNNRADVLEILRDHSDMVLREEHFASMQINWNDKVSNLRAISEELNIGLDSMVFIDDNPVERAWVRQALPDVLVVDLSEDPAMYQATLETLTVFELISLTDEDRRRGALYASERARRELKAESGSFEAFVNGLSMVLTIGNMHPKDVKRVGQLTRKTNQFTMTTKRYTDAEIEEMASHPDNLVYALRVRDVYEDNGLVGVLILRHLEKVWSIDTFLMSCRVLGRTIEGAFLAEVLSDIKKAGAAAVEADFIQTTKNGLASSFYEGFGFERVTINGGHTSWRLDLSGWTAHQPEWLTIERLPESYLAMRTA